MVADHQKARPAAKYVRKWTVYFVLWALDQASQRRYGISEEIWAEYIDSLILRGVGLRPGKVFGDSVVVTY